MRSLEGRADEHVGSPSLALGDGGEWAMAIADGVEDVRLHGAVVPRVPRGDRADVAGGRRGRQPDPSGRLTALRQAPPSIARPAPVCFLPVLPELDRPPGRFPGATVATAGITAAVAAIFFSPIFAILAGVSAIAVVGRWVGAVVSERRSRSHRDAAEVEAKQEWDRRAAVWADAEAQARQAEAFTPDRLAVTVQGEASPWWHRLGESDRIEAHIGLGSVGVEIAVEGSGPDVALVGAGERWVTIDDCPVAIEFDPGVGVCGDRAEALTVARWLVASILTRVGPADLGVVLVTTADRVDDWDQLKWSTALAGCVVVDVDRDDELCGCLDRARRCGEEIRPVLVIVDGAEPTSPGLLARVLSGRLDGVSTLWVGSSDAVPAGCRSTLNVDAGGAGLLTSIDRTEVQRFRWFGCGDVEWTEALRWLGRFDDPESELEGHGLAPAVALADLVVGDAEDRFGERLLRRWSSASTDRLVGAIGLDAEGPVELDLVADGPHVLAAGTTGSGKSELLRTLVVGLAVEQPPDVVSFVLVDFKGGGAFDAVAALPHVAAVVTDLDPSEAGRALRGLRAEILDREHRLRDMGVSDVSDVDRGHPRAFGRLVVVVDEFASLAEELPDFLDGLVDIARRGRSLGVHLVLATQRPSGVVTGQIRANTNLRLCLRVQDRGDSVDAIDDSAAAQLPSIPGRAVMRRGGERCQQLQVGHVAGARQGPTAEVFRIHPCASRPHVDGLDDIRRILAEVGGPTSSARPLVARIVEACVDTPRAAAPWKQRPASASFPVACDGQPADSGACPIGLLDDPDRRTIGPMTWKPTADGLLIVGNDEHRIAATAAVSAAAAMDDEPLLPVYVLDGDRSGSVELADLARLEPCVDIVGVGEPERLVRAVERLESSAQRQLVVINNWATVSDALVDHVGPLGAERLVKLTRRAGAQGTAMIVTARTDRDVPQRAAGALGRRVIHRLADPAGYASFGLRPDDLRSLDGAMFAEPSSGLLGVMADLDEPARVELANRLDSGGACRWPEPIRVLGDRVDRAVLPMPEPLLNGWRVPVGLDVDLDPHWIVVSAQRPVVVVGHPGGGRTTAVTTVAGALGDGVCVIDDADVMEPSELAELVANAKREGRPIVVGSTPTSAKRFGSAVAELVPEATTVMLNPGRGEGDLVRLAVPDLTDQPVGRAVAVDRGKITVIQVAA